VVGNAPESVKKNIVNKRRDRLHVHDFLHISEAKRNELVQWEYPKTPQERFCIAHANTYTTRLLKQAGMPVYDIPEKNIHILPGDLYKNICGADSGGCTMCSEQAILLNAVNVRKSGLLFGSTNFHEMLHLKGAMTIDVRNDEEKKDFYGRPFRQGLSVFGTEKSEEDFGKYEYFKGLHEAIVTFAEKAYIEELMQTSEMSEERRYWESSTIIEKRKKIAQERGVSMDDIKWVGEDGSFQSSGYPVQRKVLEFILGEILSAYPDDFSSTESVYGKFLNAHLTGHLSSIAKLVDGAIGTGAFRVLGIMGKDKESSVLVGRTLVMMRRERKRRGI